MTDRNGRRPSVGAGAAVGAAAALAVAAVSDFAHELAGLPNIAATGFGWLTRILPGPIVSFGIERVEDVAGALGGETAATAKLVEAVLAIAMVVIAGGIGGALVGGVARRRKSPIGIGIAAGALAAVGGVAVRVALGSAALAVVAVIWVVVLLIGWGALTGISLASVRRRAARDRAAGRRRALGILVRSAGISAALVVAGRWLGRAGRRRPRTPLPGTAGTSGPAASPPQAALQSRIAAAPGTRREITANEDFYRIDINLTPPRLDPRRWRLELSGLVTKPLSLTLAELRARARHSQFITLECISNRVGGDLISTCRFTGVRLGDLLGEAGVRSSARAVFIRAADGYYESVDLVDAHDPRTLLVYEMNDVPLPDRHGFPLRIYIPDRYGMKQPKWIERLEVVEHVRPGYWVERGWSEQAIPHTTAVIDAVATSMMLGQAKTIPVGGIAYAGARGISRVEVQVDGGGWAAAELRAPPLSPLTWVQWRYDWPYRPGKHTFRVRAYDGRGVLQPTEPRGPHPGGATGIHTLTTTL